MLNGYAFKSENYVDVGIRVIRIANVQKGYIEDKTPAFYPVGTKGLDKYMLEENDLLMSLTGNVGRVAILQKEMLPAALNQRVACLRLKTEKISKGYLFHILNSDLFEQKCIQSSKGVAQKNMSTEWLKEFSIPVYPEEQQREITTILDYLCDIIDKRKQELYKFDELIKARFVEMFGDPVVHLHKGETVKLDTIADKITVGFVGEASNEYVDEGVPYLRTQNVRVNRIDLKGLIYVNESFHNKNQKSIIHPGDVVISRVGANRGMAAMVPDSLPEANIANCLIVGQTDNINSYYLAFYMNMSFGKRPQFGASVGSAQGVVNTSI